MNRPRIVGIVSAVLGSSAGFLALSRWHLAGTITGAILMPVIFTLVSFGSHESLDKIGEWMRRRVLRKAGPPAEGPVSAEAGAADARTEETPAPQTKRRAAHSLHWSVVTLACLAFAVSVYSLTHTGEGTTILREKVVQTVTVTSERSALSVASGNISDAAAGGSVGNLPTTTITTPGVGDPPETTVSTTAIQTTTTTLP